ncbi:tRNA (cytosine(32)/uridine(32)-2'-O)-methyltransferase TrmJ [Aestuariirhabdus sp. Z084]|uniref:tRNA (cytosine(32)/uridine(32)-2'-O)-methyltransferase TrmJ n=1 Tax=Aestuariirhabdus haliotis TaxID=2918751 RepID=UPI00201B4552|nr:tRNA (cytosine(32)/uridine(32)-2'-O)-methyltransferase TrmJ [Aestuariirhabdus haliotis]MCL6415374.1 tRNA (cytosine(32)/uridine(32)-2'-O)-methyltransferase TrmJ [Aestuariirhabdus haliotis]MCL6419130.1 tRNA (cytosine(32)/uridine(32)-2'-O)-methyltransferase TrmJ [Aestuariirhabdus haliotis]
MSDNILVVLVNTSHPGNVGSAARAMKTMGLSRLCLVSPDQFPHEYATSRAAGADDVLEQARVVSTLDEAIADCSLVVGTSARGRKIPWPIMNPRECAERLWPESQRQQVALVFGREERGLTNDELARCHYHVHIPSDPEYSSLNLGAAVQVLSYELRMAQLASEGALAVEQEWDAEYATASELEGYFGHLQQVLEQVGFLDPQNPGQVMTRLRRLYSRQRLDKVEVNILRGVLSDTQRSLKSHSTSSTEE